MANEDLTEIVCVIDRSGSMNSLKTETIGNFNAFLDDQKGVDGDANMTLVLFDDEYEVIYDGVALEDVDDMNEDTYRPGGMTALIDAMGSTIDLLGRRFNALDEDDKPGKVIFMTITDGHENASSEYQKEQLSNMVKTQQDDWDWEFIFLGANIDSFGTSRKLGVASGSASNYAPNARGVNEAYSKAARSVKRYRSKGVKGDVNASLNASDMLKVKQSGTSDEDNDSHKVDLSSTTGGDTDDQAESEA